MTTSELEHALGVRESHAVAFEPEYERPNAT